MIMKKKIFTACMCKYGWLLLIEALLTAIVSFTVVQGNEIVSRVIDEMLSGKTVVFQSFIVQFCIFTVTGFVATFIQRMVASRYALLICTKYKNLVAEKLYRLEYRYFDSNHSATLLNKVVGDLAEISSFLESLLPEIISHLIALIIYATYIAQMNWRLFLVIVVCYPVIFKIASVLTKKIRGLTMVYREKTDTMTEITQDAVSGILVLRSFGIESLFGKKMHRAAQELVENEERRTQISNTAIIVRMMIQQLPNIISAVYAVFLVSQGTLSLGELVAFVLILDRFVGNFVGLPFMMVDAASCMVCVQRMEEVLGAQEEQNGKETMPLDTETAISFDGVDFGYIEENKVLQKLSFTVKKGENVAFVGESGGGKSTIFHMLCGFYEKTAGSYCLFGREIEDWNREALRKQLALVSQNVFLFPTTIEENIAYGNPTATHEEIVEACKKAEIHDFIMTLSDGYQTLVGERGAMLSGGQKQRISIARAILKNAPILLLDEPTSAIDVETEQLIQRAINAVSEGRTCITIAHRLSTVIDADRIMVLKQGNIVESGTHKELLQLGGVYATMYGEAGDTDGNL